MSSCDENYAKLLPVQLLSIADNLIFTRLNYVIHFYLFYSRVSPETIEYLNKYCDYLGIVFHKILISDARPYEELASNGGVASKSGWWPHEAYFTVECHKYLPPRVNRILYIDAADVLILADIGEYYFDSFDDCSLIATCARYKSDFSIFEKSDLGVNWYRAGILRGLFNSGSYVVNIKKMRRENLTVGDYIALKNALAGIYPEKDEIYFGDQGLLSAAFAGDIKYFAYPEIKDVYYQPYNFCMWFFDRQNQTDGKNPQYAPAVLHFAGGVKPWTLTNENEKDLKPGQRPFYEIYRFYASHIPSNIAEIEKLAAPAKLKAPTF